MDGSKLTALLFTVVAGIVVASGCTLKDWNCKCQSQLNVTVNHYIQNQPEGDARAICDYYQREYNYQTCTIEEIK